MMKYDLDGITNDIVSRIIEDINLNNTSETMKIKFCSADIKPYLDDLYDAGYNAGYNAGRASIH